MCDDRSEGPVIPEAKITALREALERYGRVRFHNGSYIEHERCPRRKGRGRTLPDAQVADAREESAEEIECPVCGGKKVRLIVTRPAGGETRFHEHEIRRAYEMALNGPRPKQQPPERDFGEVPF